MSRSLFSLTLPTTNGKNPETFIHSLEIKQWYTHIDCINDKKTYYRMPNHLNPVRRELALKAPFLNINHGEDREYSKNMREHLKTQVMIDEPHLYYYQYRTYKRKRS